MSSAAAIRRINVVIREAQHQVLMERGVNVSGLIRDLLGDYLSKNTITLQVSEETRKLYDLVVSNTGASDSDIEAPLRAALAAVLERRISDMRALHKRLVRQIARDEKA